MDRYIQQNLKNWAARQHAPETARARLLLIAAAQTYPLEEPANLNCESNLALLADFPSLVDSSPPRNLDLVWLFHMPIPALRMV